jgi:hypothetical protein
MTDMNQPPVRLLDDPAIADALRHDLELASNHAPLHYDVEAGLARFEKSVVGSKLSSTSGASLRVLGWVIGATVLLGGAFGAASVMSQDAAPRTTLAMSPSADLHTQDAPVAGPTSSGTREPGAPVAEAGQAGVGDAGAAIVQPAGGNPALDEPTPPRPDTTHPVDEPSDSKPGSTPKPEPEPSLADEATQINAARQALASDPAKTLALMEAAEKQFPNGAMIQERRGYAILALVALGRTTEAEQQADAYLERWPNGPLSRRVRDALGR